MLKVGIPALSWKKLIDVVSKRCFMSIVRNFCTSSVTLLQLKSLEFEKDDKTLFDVKTWV